MKNSAKFVWAGLGLASILALPAPGLSAGISALLDPPGAGESDRSAAAPAGVVVTVSPKHAAVVVTSQTQRFTATVTGNPNTTVAWSVNNLAGGNSAVGTIDANGLYTPPATPGNRTITATSTAVASSHGTATISVTDLLESSPITMTCRAMESIRRNTH